jgi:hypothetical protein
MRMTGWARRRRSRDDAADREASDVVVVLEIVDEDAESPRSRHRGGDGLCSTMVSKSGNQILVVVRELALADALLADGVEDREVRADRRRRRGRRRGRRPRSARLVRARVGAVDLVDDHDDRHAQLEGLAEHEAGLGQRPFAASTRRIAPSTMRRVRSTSPPKSAWPGVSTMLILVPCRSDRARVLGEDRDAALALEVVRVHDAIGELLTGAEGARLAEHHVDEGGLAMIDVGDDARCCGGVRWGTR